MSEEAESQFADALFDPGRPIPAGVIGPDGEPAPKRFNVYRNNVVVSLCEALGKTYPAIKSLLGEDYFNALARAYVDENPPTSPVLLHYGEAFPSFIKVFPPLASYPYLSDVALVEWFWLVAYHAADEPALEPSVLGEMAPENLGSVRFKKHCATALIDSKWPVWSLLSANRFSPDADVPINLNMGEAVLVTRQELEVDVTLLRPGAACLIRHLFAGDSLVEAAQAAQLHNQEFSLSDTLSDILSKGAFSSIALT